MDPPVIPGTERVAEGAFEFIDRWFEDPLAKWIDPETGRGYGLLDFDWENTLGAGRCCLAIRYPGRLNPLKIAALLEEIAGRPFRFSFCSY